MDEAAAANGDAASAAAAAVAHDSTDKPAAVGVDPAEGDSISIRLPEPAACATAAACVQLLCGRGISSEQQVVAVLEEVFESCRGSQRALQPLKDLWQELLPLEPWKVRGQPQL